VRALVSPAAAVVAIAFLAAGCGGGGQRKGVASYITSVNAIEARLTAPLSVIATAGRSLGARHLPRPAVRRLVRYEHEISVLKRELAGVDAPPDARRLRALLLELVAKEAALAHEVVQLVAFLPGYAVALRAVPGSTKALLHAVAAARKERTSAGKLRAQSDAFVRYGAEITGILRRLRELEPPAVGVAAYAGQVTSLERMRASSLALAEAFAQSRLKVIPRLLQDFNSASVANQSIKAQKAQIAAVRSYNARVRALDALSTRIMREQNRLSRTH
jgi:hypothetical protein